MSAEQASQEAQFRAVGDRQHAPEATVPPVETQTGGGSDGESSNPAALWYEPSDAENPHLPMLLQFASDNYERHTEWFLKHAEAGIRNLGLVITAQFAIVAFYFTPNPAGVPMALTVVLLLMSVVAAVALAVSSIASCRRSYAAALESTALAGKTAWALGLADRTQVNRRLLQNKDKGPLSGDESLYVRRYIEDISQCETTKEYVRKHLRIPNKKSNEKPNEKANEKPKPNEKANEKANEKENPKKNWNTYHWNHLAIDLFCAGAIIFGFLAAFAVWLHPH